MLGEYLDCFQVKDAVGATPVVPGEGAVPLAGRGEALRGGSGWVSLEWEKAWHPEIPSVGEPLRAAAGWFAEYSSR